MYLTAYCIWIVWNNLLQGCYYLKSQALTQKYKYYLSWCSHFSRYSQNSWRNFHHVCRRVFEWIKQEAGQILQLGWESLTLCSVNFWHVEMCFITFVVWLLFRGVWSGLFLHVASVKPCNFYEINKKFKRFL